MYNRFKQEIPQSPTALRDFVWLAEYLDGTVFSEYDKLENGFNNYYGIDRSKLLRFGLIGHGSRLYYEVTNGKVFINDNEYEFIYIDKDNKEYNLTGQYIMYNDIIQYKKASSLINPMQAYGNDIKSDIEEYNFGYKAQLNINGVSFNFKVVCTIPFKEPIFFNIRLVSDTELNGKIIIRKNSLLKYDFDLPMEKDKAAEINWTLR